MAGGGPAVLKLLSFCLCLLSLAGTNPAYGSGDVKVVVKEGSDAVLPCSLSTKESISAGLFDWRKPAQKDDRLKEVFLYNAGIHYNNGRSGQSEEFKGRVSHFPGELKHGNASIVIRNTKLTDSGNYTCDFPHLDPRQTFHIELVVAATPKPYIWTLNATEDWELLQCEVQGASPKPHLQWQDSAGNKLPAEEPQISEREDHYYITLNARVTKTDRYRCVVTQEEINHQTHAETFVYIREKVCEDSSSKVAVGWIGGWVLGAVTVVAGVILLVAANRIKILHNRGARLQGNGLSNHGNGSSNCGNGLSNQGNGSSNHGNGSSNCGNDSSNCGNGSSNCGNGSSNQGNGSIYIDPAQLPLKSHPA